MGTEITVRITLSFQDSPNVHTLLAMTPVRERRKLIFLALERYIEATGHSAGNIEIQIEEISRWLRSRDSRSEKTLLATAPSPYAVTENQPDRLPLITKDDNNAKTPRSADKGDTPYPKDQSTSSSAERWLST